MNSPAPSPASRTSDGATAPPTADSLVVNEVYISVQGESTWAGIPCVFVRLTACNLRCSYCDTAYAFTEGNRRPSEEIRQDVLKLAAPYSGTTAVGQRLPIVEFTGGEPLLQPAAARLMQRLCDDGFTVLVETSGAHDISKLDPRIRRIMDLKCPSSGEDGRNRLENLRHLRPTDEIKFVIGTREDYEWTKAMIREHRLADICPLLCSWVSPLLPHQRDPSLKVVPASHTPIARKALVDAIIADALPVRFQLQMHKFIWPPDARGV